MSVTEGLVPVFTLASPGAFRCRVVHWAAPRTRPPIALAALIQVPLAKPTRFWILAM